jgi:2-hydroxy-3-oxopropionate reductase
MVGGSEADYASAKPFFELMGKNVTLVGENGDGQTAKVANQIIVALTIEAVGEALLFASKAGADPAKVRQALSWEDLRRLGFLSFTASGYLNETLHRDSASNCIRRIWRWLLEAARVLGLSCPTPQPVELFNSCVANGLAKSDHAAMVTALELLANHSIAHESANS